MGIRNEIDGIRCAENGTNADGAKIDQDKAKRNLYCFVRYLWLEFETAKKENIPLPPEELRLVTSIFEKYLENSKTHFSNLSDNSGGLVKFEW